MTRPLNDRIAEAMRRERLGSIPPQWTDATEVTRDDWRGRAVHLLRLLRELGVFVSIEEK